MADHLRGVAVEDIHRGKEPMRFAQRPEATQTGRYVRLGLDAGLDNKRLLGLLDDSVLYQIIPWDLSRSQRPQCYLDRRRVVVEAPLPPGEQDFDVRLTSLSESKHGGRVCVLGPNERDGDAVSLGLSDIVHILIGGQTGAGKTFTMRSLAYQLANGHNEIVLVDGKRGDGLGILDGLPAQVGPLATDRATTLDALGWVYDEMIRRYDVVADGRNGRAWKDGEAGAPPHLIVFLDEPQVYRDDAAVMGVVHALSSMGRSARIHLIVGTQKPTVRMFGRDVGGATRAQFGARIAHRVQSYQDSSAIVGGNEPRADYLLPKGDAYILAQSGSHPVRERVQIAYVTEDELARVAGGAPTMSAWPTFDASVVTGNEAGRPAMQFDNQQLACAIHAARQGWGRDRLRDLLDERGVPIAGSEPTDRLMEDGREIHDELGAL